MEPGQKILRIGDQIVIKGILQQQKNQISQNQQNNDTGFISCIGNNDNKVYFQQLPNQIMQDEFKIQESQYGDGNQLSTVRNYREFVFQIWPRVNFEVHKNYRKVERQRQELLNNYRRQYGNNQQSDQFFKKNSEQQKLFEEIDQLSQQMKDLQQMMEDEWTSNRQILDKFLMKSVSYGNDIQLYHVDSDSFLNGRNYSSETEKSAYKFELSRSFSNGMIFKIEPKFKSKKLGEAVSYADRILIRNEKLHCYLNFKTQVPAEIDRPLSIGNIDKQYLYPCPQFFNNDPKSKRFDVFLSQGSSNEVQWVFYKHGIPFTDEFKDRLRGGALIRLRNTELNSLLSADILYEGTQNPNLNVNPEVYLRKYNGMFDQESTSLSSVWEVESNTFQRRGKFIELKEEVENLQAQQQQQGQEQQVNSNTQAENEDQQQQKQYCSETVRLRHFITGTLLGVSEAELKKIGEKRNILALMQKVSNAENSKCSEVKFVPTKRPDSKSSQNQNASSSNYIMNNQCFILKVNDQYVKMNPENHNYYLEDQDLKIKDFYCRLSDKDGNIERIALETTKIKSSENAFSLEFIDQKEQKDLLFLRQSLPHLLRLANILKSGQNIEELKKSEFLQNCCSTLKNLIFFVLNKNQTQEMSSTENISNKNEKEENNNQNENENDPLTCEGICEENRQRMMKSFRMIELLTDILFYPFYVHKKYFNEQLKSGLMIRTFKLCYRLIKFTIREYRPNEIYASQWIDLFMNQAMTLNYDIMAEPTLTELIDNNRTVLETKINEEIIQKFVDLLVQNGQTQYLKLLRALINCNGEAVINNQKLITQKVLIQDPQNNQNFKIRDELFIDLKNISKPEDQYQIIQILYKNNWIDLTQLQQKSLSDYQNNGADPEVNIESINNSQDNIIILQQSSISNAQSKAAADNFYNYFLNYISLLADLCLERNFLAIQHLKKYITFDMCYSIMSSSTYPYEMRTAFTDFFINCWVDGWVDGQDDVQLNDEKGLIVVEQKEKKCLPKIKVPNYFRIWKNILGSSMNNLKQQSQDDEIVCCEKNTKKFQIIMTFINSHLKLITENGYQRIWDKGANQFTLQVLKMCKILVNFGTYKTPAEINALIKPLLQFLNSSFDVTNKEEEQQILLQQKEPNSQQNKNAKSQYGNSQDKLQSISLRYEETEETKILTQCRLIILEILKFYSRLQMDIQATKLISQFKKYTQENQQNFNYMNLNDQSDMQMIPKAPSSPEKIIPESKNNNLDSNMQESKNLLKPLSNINSNNNIAQIKQSNSSSNEQQGIQSEQDQNNEQFKQFLQWLQSSVSNPSIQIASQAPVNYTAILLDLLLYDNQDFLNFVFQNLHIQFAQVRSLCTFALNVQIIEDDNKIQMLEDTKNITDQLNDLADTCETWLTKKNEEAMGLTQKTIQCLEKLFNYLTSGNQQGQKLGSNQQDDENHKEQNTNTYVLEEINLTDNNNIQNVPKLNSNQSAINAGMNIDEKYINFRYLLKHISMEYQLLMKNFQLYDPIIRILKFHFDISKPEETEQSTQLLQYAYKVLALFVFENNDNKQIMEIYLDFALKHMCNNYESLAYVFIQELIRNNRKVLYNQALLERNILPTLAKIIDKIKPFSNILKAMHLNIFQIFLKGQNKILKNNQILVLTTISNNVKYKNILLLLNIDQKLFQEFNQCCQDLSSKTTPYIEQQQQQIQDSVIIDLPNIIQYFETLMELMSATCEDKNSSTESKSQNLFKVPFLLQLMKASYKCWPVRIAIVNFFYNVYIEIEKEINDQGAFFELLKEMNNDLLYISKNYENIINCGNVILRGFKGQHRLRQIIDEYIYSSLLQCFSLILQHGTIYKPKEVQEFYKQFCQSMILLAKQTNTYYCKKYIARIFQRIEQRDNIKKAINYVKEFQDKIPDSIKMLKDKKNKSKQLQPGQQQNKTENNQQQQQNPQILINNNDQQQFKGNSNQMQNILQIQQLGDKQQANSYNDIFHYWLKCLQTQSEDYEKLIQLEFESMVQAIKDIEKITEKAFKGHNTLTFSSVCKKLIQLIDPIDEILKPDLSLIGLSAFRKIIEMENTKLCIPASEWESEDYEEFSKQILIRQNQLVDYGIIPLIFNMFTLDVREDLKHEAILVAISVLLGGNQNAQQAFFNLFQTDYKNLFMVQLNNMLENSFQIVKKYQDRINNNRSQKKNNTQILQVNDEDEAKGEGQDQNQSKIFVQQQSDNWENEEMVRLRNLFRFMQLLCEGHYSEMQNYFRKQIQQGVASGKSINFLKTTVIQFGTFIRFINVESISLGKQMLNFLIEAIQGPCPKNQETLANSKLIDFTKTLFQKFVKKNISEENADDQAVPAPEKVNEKAKIQQVDINAAKIAPSQVIASDPQGQLLQPIGVDVQKENEQNQNIGEGDQGGVYSDYIRVGFVTAEQRQLVEEIVSISTKLLLSMVEANKDEKISVFLSNQIDFEFIKNKLVDAYSQFVSEELKLDPVKDTIEEVISEVKSKYINFEGSINDSFSMYMLIVTLADSLKNKVEEYGNPAQDCLDSWSNEEEQEDPKVLNAYNFFQQNTISIEANFQGQLYRIFFPLQPACRNLSKATRENIMIQVKRDTQNDKIQDLLGSIGPLFTEMEHLSYLRTLPIRFTSNGLKFLRNFSTLMAVIMNLFLLATYDRKVEHNKTKIEIEDWSVQTINAFGIAQLVSSILMLFFWLIINLPIIIRIGWDDYVSAHAPEINPENEAKLEEATQNQTGQLGEDTNLLLYALRVKGPYNKLFYNSSTSKTHFGSIFGRLFYLEKCTLFLLSNGPLQYLIFYITCSILGFFYADIAYCFQLLDIIYRFPLLHNVVQSITGNFNQIALTYIFGNIIMYIYAVFGFYFLAADFYNPGIGSGENMCTNLFQCYLWTVQLGLRNGGGISESMTIQSDSPHNQDRYWFRFFFDVTFFLLIQIIFLNIIFGIIIDTFAGHRDEKTAMQEDMKNNCYICGLDRYTLEKNADGFENHIERDHQLWNYIYYVFYIQNKSSTDLNGIESQINEQIESLDISWVPLMSALSIGSEEQVEDEKSKFSENLKTMEEKINVLKIKANQIK